MGGFICGDAQPNKKYESETQSQDLEESREADIIIVEEDTEGKENQDEDVAQNRKQEFANYITKLDNHKVENFLLRFEFAGTKMDKNEVSLLFHALLCLYLRKVEKDDNLPKDEMTRPFCDALTEALFSDNHERLQTVNQLSLWISQGSMKKKFAGDKHLEFPDIITKDVENNSAAERFVNIEEKESQVPDVITKAKEKNSASEGVMNAKHTESAEKFPDSTMKDTENNIAAAENVRDAEHTESVKSSPSVNEPEIAEKEDCGGLLFDQTRNERFAEYIAGVDRTKLENFLLRFEFATQEMDKEMVSLLLHALVCLFLRKVEKFQTLPKDEETKHFCDPLADALFSYYGIDNLKVRHIVEWISQGRLKEHMDQMALGLQCESVRKYHDDVLLPLLKRCMVDFSFQIISLLAELTAEMMTWGDVQSLEIKKENDDMYRIDEGDEIAATE